MQFRCIGCDKLLDGDSKVACRACCEAEDEADLAANRYEQRLVRQENDDDGD